MYVDISVEVPRFSAFEMLARGLYECSAYVFFEQVSLVYVVDC